MASMEEVQGYRELKRREKTALRDAAQKDYLVTQPELKQQQRVYDRWCHEQNKPAVEVHMRGEVSDVYLRMGSVADPYSRTVFPFSGEYIRDLDAISDALRVRMPVEVNTTFINGSPVTCFVGVPANQAEKLAKVLLEIANRHAQRWLAAQAKVYRRQ
ncbi:MAG: hypothetical protein Kow00120_25060 [Anaerolineae bacterium]